MIFTFVAGCRPPVPCRCSADPRGPSGGGKSHAPSPGKTRMGATCGSDSGMGPSHAPSCKDPSGEHAIAAHLRASKGRQDTSTPPRGSRRPDAANV